MKSSSLQCSVRHGLAVVWFLAGLLSSHPVCAQLTKALSPPAPAPAQSPEASQDPLGRTTPRGTVIGFLTASYNRNFEVAAQYLNTRHHAKDPATLAEQLFYILDRRLPAKLNNLSNDPQGSLANPLDSGRELVGQVESEDGPVEIYLERVDRPNAAPIWLFSRETLAAVPDLYQEVSAVTTELPPLLLRRFLGFEFFGWVFFLLVLPLQYVLLTVVNRLLVSAWQYGSRHWAKLPEISDRKLLPYPVRLLVLSWTIHVVLARFSVSLMSRAVGSITETILLIVALVWLVILFNEKCEAFVRKRMESRGRLTSTAVLRAGRRVMDVIACVIGLMFALHSFGVNPSAALAGLGVGGIAVALAAQKTLENVIGGASLILDEAVRVGDFFKVGEVTGTVEAIGLRSTRVRTLDRTVVTIPNGQMATMVLENFSSRDNFWLRHVVGLGYDIAPSNLSAVLAALRKLLRQDSRVVPASVRVRLLRFNESTLDVEIFAYALARDWSDFLEIQEDLLIQIWEAITSNGAQIAYPVRTIHVKNERTPEDPLAQLPHQVASGEDGFLR